MKVGILSLSSGYNFGGTLQTVALSRTLQRQGHDVTVLDYWPTPPRKVPPWRGWGLAEKDRLRRIRCRLAELRHLGKFRGKYEAFKNEELKWSQRCLDKESLARASGEMEAVVVGSDQVWNLHYHPDPNYYLADFDHFNGRRISYAACCGNPNQECPGWVAGALKKFDWIGVRNSFTAAWVERCGEGSLSPTVVADPTLLIDDYPAKRLDLPEKFIAVYLIGQGKESDEFKMIDTLRRKFGALPVVCLMATGISIRFRRHYDHILWDLDPFEWVEVIRRATAVYTDSFHAVLFSLRFQVPLIATFVEEVRAPRLIDLRDRFDLGLSVRKVTSMEPVGDDPDWASIAKQFEKDRDFSLAFLSNSLA
jgi:hypothetical protein